MAGLDGNGRIPRIELTIRPEPTADERDAVAAVIAILSTAAPGNESSPVQTLSPWTLAGRRGALRGRETGARRGWGRAAPGWSMR